MTCCERSYTPSACTTPSPTPATLGHRHGGRDDAPLTSQPTVASMLPTPLAPILLALLMGDPLPPDARRALVALMP